MIKRSTAYFYILLTSFVLLAHAVIPHHYHESEIFIVNSDCQTDKGAHQQGSTEHKHNGHDEGNTEFCIVQQVVLVRSIQYKLEIKSLDRFDNQSKLDIFQAFLFNKDFSLPFPTSLSNALLFQKPSRYSFFVSIGLGLRAPPAIV
ncbi:MAG: DUF6769 family protein [Bacteroidota bacterium]